MSETEITYFQLLKREIAEQLRTAFPEVDKEIEEWKGKEIRYLQEDLIRSVNGRVSEKWFYTHIKSEHEHLPRIDMLDLLSQYVGFRSWEHFKTEKKSFSLPVSIPKKLSIRPFWIGITAALVLMGVFYLNARQPEHYQFCFVNAYNQQPIQDASLSIIILHNNESPYRMLAGDEGCIQFSSDQEEVQFVVKGPYYHTDTIVRKLNKQQALELIPLRTNDYAWMIRVFSNAKVEDWKLRRAQLDSMISEEARIYQIFDHEQLGMEMHNKWDFINKLTMPVQSLSNIEILDMQYVGDKIKTLRFKQIQAKNHE